MKKFGISAKQFSLIHPLSPSLFESNMWRPWQSYRSRYGTFSIEFADAPDDFSVCGHPIDSNGFLPLKPTAHEAAKKPDKLSCSKQFRLDGDHLGRRVTLKLR
jgi:hypothetical protein